jgi:chemotaxis protein CheD
VSTGSGLVLHVLSPGDVALGLRDERMETLLGSCIAIVLTDPRRTLGAMCHIVHTGRPARSGSIASRGAHGDGAFTLMFQLLRHRGIDPLQCEAYVYGGGNMFPQQVTEQHVGDRNATWALDELATWGIRVVHHDVGGSVYRRLSWTVGPDAPRVVAVTVAEADWIS